VTKSAIWLSYDLGVQGDYSSLYEWLDEHKAKECGDSLAFFNYEHEKPIKDQLKIDLKDRININNRTRIYVIYRDHATTKNKGAFIFGGRRDAPWTGCASNEDEVVDEEGA